MANATNDKVTVKVYDKWGALHGHVTIALDGTFDTTIAYLEAQQWPRSVADAIGAAAVEALGLVSYTISAVNW